ALDEQVPPLVERVHPVAVLPARGANAYRDLVEIIPDVVDLLHVLVEFPGMRGVQERVRGHDKQTVRPAVNVWRLAVRDGQTDGANMLVSALPQEILLFLQGYPVRLF